MIVSFASYVITFSSSVIAAEGPVETFDVSREASTVVVTVRHRLWCLFDASHDTPLVTTRKRSRDINLTRDMVEQIGHLDLLRYGLESEFLPQS